MKKGTNPNRKTSTKYEVVVNGETGNTFGTLKESRVFKNTLSVDDGTTVQIYKHTSVLTVNLVDTYTPQLTKSLVSSDSMVDSLETTDETTEQESV